MEKSKVLEDKKEIQGVRQTVQAIVLAAGLGTRLFPLTSVSPKALLPIANIPLIDYVVDSIQSVGIKDIVVVTGYLGLMTAKYLEASRKSSTAEIKCITAERYEEGPIYSLLAGERFVKNDFLLIPADLVLDHKILTKLVANHTEKDTIYAATSNRPIQPERAFVLCHEGLEHDNPTILRFSLSKNESEKSKENRRIQAISSIGVVICPSRIFEYVHLAAQKGSTRVIDALNEYVAKTGLGRCIIVGRQHRWFDVDTIDDMLEANSYILGKRSTNTRNQGHLYLDRETSITVGARKNNNHSQLARVLGPALVGKKCVIGESSIIGPCVSIQDNCIIGKNARISNAIILSGSVIDESAVINRAVVCGKEILRAGRTSRDVNNE
jgi:NDP-sugar pyrophosphorylase family protein